jgi:pilus assembly protein FimV
MTESESPHAPFPSDAVNALNDLDMALPPRADGHLPPDENGAVPEHTAAASDAAHEAQHEVPREAEDNPEPGTDAVESESARAHGSDALSAGGVASPQPAPAAVAGLGAARFGALNLAFDLDLPGAENGAPARVAMPEQPMFSQEEMAKIARNKLELAAEYIALGDLGGARTLIHEVIESNDPGTREEAHALLATLAPLS